MNIMLERHRVSLMLVAAAIWVPIVILADVDATLSQQRLLGVLSWLLLIVLLRREAPLMQAQVLAAVAFATLIEYTASPLLRLYVYRLENVPSFVPPGHGVIYLAALVSARTEIVQRHVQAVRWVALAACGSWAAWGLLVSPRTDTLGAVLYLIFGACLLAGREPGIYAAAFVVTTYLELIGTSLGSWTWSVHDPANLFSIGNPPSGIAGGYCVIDWIGLIGGRALLGRLQRRNRPALLQNGGRNADDAGQKPGDLGPALAPVV